MKDLSQSLSEPPVGSLLASFLDAASLWQARMEEELKVVGLSRSLYSTLAHLASAGRPLTQKELAEIEQCAASNITQKIDRLEKEGLVRRIGAPTDRRIILAELTPLGSERAAAGSRILERIRTAFESAIPVAEHSSLARVLSALA